jgi:F-type H+-transporting ATPase subunit a
MTKANFTFFYQSPLAQFEILFASNWWDHMLMLQAKNNNFMLDNPLHPWAIIFNSLFFSFANACIFVFFFTAISNFKNNLFPKTNEEKARFFMFKSTDNFIRNNNVSAFQPYYLFYFEIIIAIFYYNVSGLTPISFTITAQLYAAFTLAFVAFFGLNATGVFIRKWKFLNNFLPEGTLFELVWLVVFLELVSYLSRLFSLSIRLFANIIAGHALLKIFASFLISAIFSGGLLVIPAFFGVGGLFIIFILELAVALLQLYVFITLLFFYMFEGIRGGH